MISHLSVTLDQLCGFPTYFWLSFILFSICFEFMMHFTSGSWEFTFIQLIVWWPCLRYLHLVSFCKSRPRIQSRVYIGTPSRTSSLHSLCGHWHLSDCWGSLKRECLPNIHRTFCMLPGSTWCWCSSWLEAKLCWLFPICLGLKYGRSIVWNGQQHTHHSMIGFSCFWRWFVRRSFYIETVVMTIHRESSHWDKNKWEFAQSNYRSLKRDVLNMKQLRTPRSCLYHIHPVSGIEIVRKFQGFSSILERCMPTFLITMVCCIDVHSIHCDPLWWQMEWFVRNVASIKTSPRPGCGEAVSTLFGLISPKEMGTSYSSSWGPPNTTSDLSLVDLWRFWIKLGEITWRNANIFEKCSKETSFPPEWSTSTSCTGDMIHARACRHKRFPK